MKNRKLLLIVSLILAMTMAMGGTLAYLTDTDEAVNVMTLGNVDIEQNEEDAEGNPFEQNQPLYPAYYPDENYDADTVVGAIDKVVTVENVGTSDAYVRTVLAFEAGNLSKDEFDKYIHAIFETEPVWVDGVAEIDGTNYYLAYVVYDEALAPGAETAPSLVKVVMDKHATNDIVKEFGDTYEILVVSQACQTVNMPDDADTALKAAFRGITADDNPWVGDNATNKRATVTTDAELKAAIEDPLMDKIIVDGDLTYDWGGESYANSKALLMAGKTIEGADEDAAITFAGYGSANPITDVTLRNITVKDVTKGDDEGSWEHGHLEFDSLKAENVTFANSIMLSGNSELVNCAVPNHVNSWYGAWVEGGTAKFEKCTFSGTRGLKIHEAYGSEVVSVVVDDCTFELSEKPGVVIGDLNAATTVKITDSTFATTAGDQGKYIYESDTEVETFNFSESNNEVIKELLKISTAEELFAFAKDVNENKNSYAGEHVVLTADIDLKNQDWEPIGQTGATQFRGTFDGMGYTISNLNVDSLAETGGHYSSGLFGWLNAATVRNVKVDGATVKGNHNVAVIAGYLETKGCTVSNCHVSNATVVGKHANDDACGDKVGVVVGHAGNTDVKVEKCSASNCTVTAGRDAGQIAGAAKTANVVDCTATDVTVAAGGDCTGVNIKNEVIGRIL